MKLRQLLGIALMAASLSLSAQEQSQADAPRKLSLEEYTAGSPQYRWPPYLRGLQWLGNRYIYAKGKELVAGDKLGKEAKLLDASELAQILHLESLDYIPYFSVRMVEDTPLLHFSMGKKEYFVDPNKRQLTRSFVRPEGMQASQYNPQLSHIALVRNHNLEIHPLRTREAIRQITTDGSPSLVYGQSVHQQEFGIDEGLFWSPDGRKLAFYRMDQSMVTPYPILHIDAKQPYSEAQYYPMAGTPSHQVTLGVYDLQSGQTLYLKTGLPLEKYLTNVAWTPDSQEILIAEVNREQTDCTLNAYSASTGERTSTLFSEHNDKYIEPQHRAEFLPDGTGRFLWQSRRDGWMHLYLYSREGKLLRQLTRGQWEVSDFLGFSPDGRKLFYESTEVSPLERHSYSLSLSNGRTKRITSGRGWHSTRLSQDGTMLLDSYQSQEIASSALLLSTDKARSIKTILEPSHPDRDIAAPLIELGTLKAADKTTDLHYRLIKPYDFDPSRQYPAIIYVYNGPHAQLVQERYRAGARGWELHMANLGYIILTVDGRGSAYRGAKFEQTIHRQVGTHEMADQIQGVELLRRLGYVDMKRLGVYGWSYGGFMTTNLMLSYPEVFKVGVAGGPVMDWSRYEIMYGERYMDSPEENPEGYKANNLLLRTGDLKGRLLLIHGTIDPVVIWQHSLLFVQAAVRAGSMPDYMVYPEHKHNVLGEDRIHLNKVITRYFQDHL